MNDDFKFYAKWAALIAFIILLFFFTSCDNWLGLNSSEAHEVDEYYEPGVDSVKVQLEIDADGDNTWEVRHVFFDKRGVWEYYSQGMMRITVTEFNSIAPDSTETWYYNFWVGPDEEALWQSVKSTYVMMPDSTVAQVLLPEFAGFGMAYGDTIYHQPESGMKMFESPHWVWWLTPRGQQ